MKRLIAISVVFALAAGAVFAVDLGGAVIGAVTVAGASGGGDAELFNGGIGRARLEGSGDAEVGIGTIGGWLRYDIGGTAVNTSARSWEDPEVGVVTWSGLAWWQPIDQVKLQIGLNPDGHFDVSHIGRYGFYAQANEIGMVNSNGNWGPTSYDSAIFGGYSTTHFGLIITPTDAVTINVAIPLNEVAAGDDKQPAVAFKKALFQINYAADFGAIHVTYQGKGETFNLVSAPTAQTGKLFASAYLGSLVDGLGLEVGAGFGLPAEDAFKSPLAVGLGVTYSTGAFGVKLRGIFEIPMEDGGKTAVRADLLPYYAVNDNVTVYGDLGVYLTGADEQFAWHFNPYVRVGAEWGTSFYAGITLDNGSGVKDSKSNWGIPVGIIASF